MEYNEEFLRIAFTKETIAKKYHKATFGSQLGVQNPQTFALYRKNIDEQIVALESILERLDLYPEPASLLHSPPDQTDQKAPSNKVFVVHGHDEGARESVAGFLRQLGIEPIILNQQVSRSRTVIEKVEANSGVGFAIVLLTPDDEGRVKGGTLAPRARQNVMLELGYFIGLLGRQNVCAFRRGDVEIPSERGKCWPRPGQRRTSSALVHRAISRSCRRGSPTLHAPA
jgi:predicted nucleotide-binding protein